ncbi:MAG: hypothetical protein AB8B67_02905 [Rickettsiaceae bacterium]
MKKLLYVIIFIIFIFVAIYCGIWFFITGSVKDNLNNHFSDDTKYLFNSKKDLGWNEEIALSFGSCNRAGFPFSFGVQCNQFALSTPDVIIDAKNPVMIGYNLFSDRLSINYSGEFTSKYKASKGNESQFGVKGVVKNIALNFNNTGFSNSIFQILLANNLANFSIINILHNFTYTIQNLNIFDIDTNDLIYSMSEYRDEVKFDNSKYYTSFEDLKNNMPNNVTFYEVQDVQKGDYPLLYLLFDFERIEKLTQKQRHQYNINFRTYNNKFEDLLDKFELSIDTPTLVNEFVNGHSLFALEFDNSQESRMKINSKSTYEIKSGYFNYLIQKYRNILSILMRYESRLIPNSIQMTVNLDKEVASIHEYLKLDDFENRKYNNELKVSFDFSKNDILTFNIHNFDISTDTFGIQLNGELQSLGKANGSIAINNYPEIIDYTMPSIYTIETFKDYSDSDKRIYNSAMKKMIRLLSEQPDSESPDAVINYDINLVDLSKSKIGSVLLSNILSVYYQSIFNEIKHSGLKHKDTKSIIAKLLLSNPEFKPYMIKFFKGQKQQNDKSKQDDKSHN